jgi:hypothetical protein
LWEEEAKGSEGKRSWKKLKYKIKLEMLRPGIPKKEKKDSQQEKGGGPIKKKKLKT